jgi:hypothetical protein
MEMVPCLDKEAGIVGFLINQLKEGKEWRRKEEEGNGRRVVEGKEERREGEGGKGERGGGKGKGRRKRE